MSAYNVTTIGDVEGVLEEPAATPCGCHGPKAAPCGCGPKTSTIAGLEDWLLLNPATWPTWVAKRVAVEVAKRATGKDPVPTPSAIDELAKTLGIDPVALVLGGTGYDGWGRHWDTMKIVGGVGVLAAVVAWWRFRSGRGARAAGRSKRHVRRR